MTKVAPMTDGFFASEIIWPGLCAGLLIGMLCAWYGVFVVQRGLGFLSAGLAHAAFGGVALGLVLGLSQPLWVALPFMVVVAILLCVLRHKTGVRHDTLIGMLFSVSMAFGLIVLQYRDQLTSDAMSYLFGDLVFVQWSDVYLALALLLVTAALLPMWSRWAYASFDEELAQADRIDVKRDDYILIIMIALLVAAAVKIAGIILCSAFFVIPPACAVMLSRHFTQCTIYAVVIGALSVFLGMYLSYYADWPCGAAVVAVQALCFVFSAMVKRFV